VPDVTPFAVIAPPELPPPVPPYSHAVVSGDVLAVSGQMPIADDGSFLADAPFDEQARQVFRNLERCLAAAGCTFRDVFKVNGYLADLADVDAYNALYRERFAPPYPARTTVQAALIGPNTLIEVDLLARVP
jgi:2-iminobutanoate/2-iminopropanoate deaminase